MIHEILDIAIAIVTSWAGYRIGYATKRREAKVIPPPPSTPYRSPEAAEAPKPPPSPIEYVPFRSKRYVECSRCGGGAARDNTGNKKQGYFQYCPGGRTHDMNKISVACDRPHFTRACQACNFSWFEATKDTSPPEDAPVLKLVPTSQSGKGGSS